MTEQFEVLVTQGTLELPHPYLVVWQGLRLWETKAKTRPLPSSGGWLDQDAELMWAIELLDRLADQHQSAQQGMDDLAEFDPTTAGQKPKFTFSGSFEPPE